MSKKINKQADKFFATFSKYVKHQGIELELTLASNEKILVNQNRYLDGKELVQFYGNKETSRIPVSQIKKAEFYVY